jgi:hypothetical protein
MLKKIVLAVLFLGLIGALVAGAVIRTTGRTSLVAEARGGGYGHGQDHDEGEECDKGGAGIALRDAFGRPAWAGAGRNAQGSNPGGYGNQGSVVNPQPNGREDAPGDGTGTGQAEVEEWLSLQGTVVSVDANALVVQTTSGEQVRVENRAWWFAQEQGFWTQAGHQVTLVGFYEGDDPSRDSGQRFEVGRIEDNTNGQTVLVREENGRPLWAGRGRRSGL